MITISELDNWEISSCSGMKYGQFVDWEKIHPEAAQRYQQILKSEHQQLKTMGREGFWGMPHTLRAKAYYHIIHNINSRLWPLLNQFRVKTHFTKLSEYRLMPADAALSTVALSLQIEMSTMNWPRCFLENRKPEATQYQSTWRQEKYPGTFMAYIYIFNINISFITVHT